MDPLDEFLKKSAPKGTKSISNIDDFIGASKPKEGYVAPKIEPVKEQQVIEPEKRTPRGRVVYESGKTGLQLMLSSVKSGVNEYNKFFYNKTNNGKGAFGESYEPVYNLNNQDVFDYEEKVKKQLIDKIGEEAADTYLSKASMAVGQGLGQVGAFLVNPLVGYTTITAQTIDAGKNAYDEAYKSSIEQGMSESKSKKIANINGIVTGSVNMLEVVPFFQAFGVSKDILLKPIKKSLSATMGRIAKTMLAESATEGVQQFAQDITARYTYKKDEAGQSVPLKNAIQSFLVSLPTGLLFGGAGEANIRLRLSVLESAKNEVANMGTEAGLNTEQATQMADVIVDQYTVLGDQDVFEETKEEKKAKIEKILPEINEAVINRDDNIIDSAKNLAEEIGDKETIKKVDEAIAKSNENAEKIKNIEDVIEASAPSPEKELTEPTYIPYKPARAIPSDRVYQNSSVSKFIIGEFEGKPYTSDAYIMEFNSDVQPPSKTITVDGKKVTTPKVEVFTKDSKSSPAPDENAIRKIIPADEDLQSVEIVKVQQSEDGKQKFVTLEGEGIKLDMQQKYFDYFSKKYPGATFKAQDNKRPVVVYKGGQKVGLIMPMNLTDFKKLQTTWQKPNTAQVKLSDTKIEKETPAQKKIKELEKKNIELEEKSKRKGLSSGELGSLASPHGNKTIRKIIERQKTETVNDTQEVPKDFKISERAKSILEKYGVKVSERTLSNRLLGVFKPLTDKVRVQALYDVTTVTHEAIHAIDNQTKFAENLIASTGRGEKIRNRLTDIYEELYPKAKRTHKLEIRIKEGLAVLFENYFYDPASIQAKYPDLVDAFIKPEGQYYNPKFTELLEDMNQLVNDYATLSPEQRIASRIRTGKEVVDKQTGFTKKQRLEYEVFNRFEPLKRYGQEAGVSATWEDPYVQAFNIMNKNSVVTNWIQGKNTPILMRDGNFKIEEGSVQSYVKLIKGKEDAFRSYLIARRVVADNNKLNDLKNEIREINEIDAEDGDVDIISMRNEISKLEKTIEKDDFSLQDATAVVEKYTDEFKEAETIYDDINRRLLDFSVQNDLIDAETAELYKNEPGYASFKRYIDEELTSVGTVKTSSKSKVTSFKERTGSQLDIIDPIYSQVLAINEIIGKGMENRLWNKVADIANKNTEISQRFEKIKSEPAIDANGNISFPQEKQPDIIRIFRKGKREFYRAGPEFIAVSKQLRGKEYDTFVQMLRIPSSIFTRLTTSANPFFAVGNISVDQFSALAQTKTGFKPVVDPAKSLYKYLNSDKGVGAYIAMGGKRQTLSAFYDLSPDQIVDQLSGGKTATEKVSHAVDSVIGVLEIPANISEIMTRYSEFSRAKDMGKTDSEAMFMAAEVTTPFQLQGNLGGRFGQEYIKSIPYLNSIMQVLYKYGRSAKDNPVRMTTVTASLLTVGLTAAIAMMKGSSEEQKRLFAEQPVRNASRYLYFPSPNGKDLIKLRIPEQMGVYTGMAYLYVVEHYNGNESTFNDYLDVVSSTVPEQIQIWDPEKSIPSYIPQALKPGVQTAFNTKTFPEVAPIVPYYMQGRKASEQYNNYTSRVAKGVGQWLNISPAKFEFFVKSQFGAVGSMLLGKKPTNPINIQEKEYVMTGRSYNRFYDNRELVQQNYDEKLKDNPDKYTYEQKYEAKSDLKLYNDVSDLLTEMGKINKKTALPDDIKSTAYEVLLGLDGDKDVMPSVYKLKEQIQTFNLNSRESQ